MTPNSSSSAVMSPGIAGDPTVLKIYLLRQCLMTEPASCGTGVGEEQGSRHARDGRSSRLRWSFVTTPVPSVAVSPVTSHVPMSSLFRTSSAMFLKAVATEDTTLSLSILRSSTRMGSPFSFRTAARMYAANWWAEKGISD